MPPSQPLIYADALVPDPHMAMIITAIASSQQAPSLTPPPRHPLPRAADTSPRKTIRHTHVVIITSDEDSDTSPRKTIRDRPESIFGSSSDEDSDTSPRKAIRYSPVITGVIGGSTDEDSDTSPRRYSPVITGVIGGSTDEDSDTSPRKTRKERRKESSRSSKRAVAMEKGKGVKRPASSASSIADDGTIALILQLKLDDDNNVITPDGKGDWSGPSRSQAPTLSTSNAVDTAPPHVPAPSTLNTGGTVPPSPVTPGRKTYVVFAGTEPGIYEEWPFVKGLVNKVSHNIYKGYKTRLQAERAWVLANALGSVRILNGEGDAIAAPSSAIPPLVLGALGEVPEEFLDATWYVVVKGRTPGVYPA
ncbi:hypothetical protein FIBSPDRAFT_966228, partial [Athelia psychrophila]